MKFLCQGSMESRRIKKAGYKVTGPNMFLILYSASPILNARPGRRTTEYERNKE